MKNRGGLPQNTPILITLFLIAAAIPGKAEDAVKDPQYTVGVDDILEISVLQPDELLRVVNVAPDGQISFPYIGSIAVKDLTIPQIQEKIQNALADGYMKYPVVLVSLQESRSRKFFVYGEVAKPGTYAIAENTTVLRAISDGLPRDQRRDLLHCPADHRGLRRRGLLETRLIKSIHDNTGDGLGSGIVRIRYRFHEGARKIPGGPTHVRFPHLHGD